MPERLVAHDVFSFLRPEQVNAISERAERVRFPAGAIVYERGEKPDYLYAVLDGQVTLHLPGAGGFSIVIDQLGPGDMFGSCMCFQRNAYALTAQCARDCELLKIEAAALKELMDRDLRMGYALQTRISAIYFGRYIETMQKLQAVTMSLPMEYTPSA
ncbi:MAG: cyclic nucleotide-binding domain-containing protein [Gemmatimonadota bacterium]|jgi:CRP-like cAMP-binding protein